MKTFTSWGLAFFCIFLVLQLKAQNNHDKKIDGFNLNCHYGYVFAHHFYIQHLVTGHFPLLEASVFEVKDGSKEWHQAYNFPESGWMFKTGNLNNQYLGSFYAGYYYIKVPIIKKAFFSPSFKIAGGLGYLTEKFDRFENYKNIAIGSHVNAALDFSLQGSVDVSERIALNTSVSFTHFSNGAFRAPNLGINVPSLGMGIHYRFNRQEPRKISSNMIDSTDKQLHHYFILAGGIMELLPTYGKKYPAVSLSYNLGKRFNAKYRLGIGTDFFYNNAHHEILKRDGITVENELELIRPGIHVSNALTFGKAEATLFMGAYLYAKNRNDGFLYHRVSFSRRIKHILMSVAVKSHFAKAELVEFGIGYVL